MPRDGRSTGERPATGRPTGAGPVGEGTVSPLLGALRSGTRAEHRALDRELDLPHRIRTRNDLAVVLGSLLASWQPLERGLATACDWSAVPLDPHLGEAAHLLRVDIRSLGHPDPAAGSTATADARLDRSTSDGDAPDEPASGRPAFDGPARAVGGRYVLLGSAMGGRILAPLIEQRLGLAPAAGTSFFRRDGTDPYRDWVDFRTAIAATTWSQQDTDEAVAAARHTFTYITAVARALLATAAR